MKFAIIGTNFVSDTLMEGAKDIPDFELAVVCSRTKEHAQAFADKYGCKNIILDYRDITPEMADAVYIATPNSMHHEQTLHFLNKKMHVLCEKPLASNIKEVLEMFETADRNNVMLLEAIVPLFTPNFLALKEAATKVGKVRRAVFSFGKYSSRYDAYRAGNVMNAFKNELSNGSLMDLGVYSLSNCIAIFGKPTKVLASAYMLESNVDGLGTMLLSYPDKEVIIMHSKITDSHFDSEIQGEDGTVIVKAISSPQAVKVITRQKEIIEMTAKQKPETKYYELAEFIKCVKSKNYHSELVPRQLTIDVHTIMTDVRQQINLVFPADSK
ncbi:MAG: Gfo/Idh/MocA family oxidoreductase [Erysipelotrichaceae bacterium]|nr:Gfo/Idh/MocA family oxidoreductase [Erysipelotrichaceae bacterium]MDD4642083.1 Gfo/Idh/MocA family oxidoreductase [Erysipelotrichaceae bacterium]